MESKPARLLALLFLLGLVSCERGDQNVLRLEEDGTPLIRSLLPRVRGNPFQLVEEVEFGTPGGDEAARLFRPRGIAEVPDGVAVLDSDSNTIKIYEDDGTLRMTVGGRGQGPGEFDEPSMSHGLSYNGRLFVTDSFALRFTWIDPETGAFESKPQQLTWDAASVAEDRFLIIHPRFEQGMQVEALELVNGEFDTLATLVRVRPGRVLFLPSASGSTFPLDQPFWPPFDWWAQGGIVAACQGDAFRVEVFDYEGNRRRIVEWNAPRLPVTDAAWDSMSVYIRERYGENWATAMQQMERPELVAAVEGLRIDDRGRIWALRDDGPTYATHIESDLMYWDVIEADGSWLGTQSLETVPWYFGEDVCYMIEDRDEGSVVVRYRLVPSGLSPVPGPGGGSSAW